MMFSKRSVAQLVALASTFSVQGAITSVSVPQESQDFGNNDSYPAQDDLWSVTVPPLPFDTFRGIGHIIDISASVLAIDIDPRRRLGVLHSHKMSEPFVPVFSAVVTYGFDAPTVVDALEILQHTNGITRVEGFVGSDLAAMTSIGNAFGPLGDVKGEGLFTEGEANVFDFNNSFAGTIFQFRITQTSQSVGYALHRAFPLGSDSQRIAAVPEPSGPTLLVIGLLGIIARRSRHSQGHFDDEESRAPHRSEKTVMRRVRV